jgi:hypothetical protein
MRRKLLRTIQLILGFTLQFLVFGWIVFTPFFKLQREMDTHLQQLRNDQDIHTVLTQSLRQFDAAQIAMLRFRETNERKFTKEATQCLVNACKGMAEVHDRAQGTFTKHYSGELLEEYKDFQTHYETEVRIGEELEQLGTEKHEEAEQLRVQQREVRQKLDSMTGYAAISGEAVLEYSKGGLELSKSYLEIRIRSLSETVYICIWGIFAMFVIEAFFFCFAVAPMIYRSPEAEPQS